MSKISSIWFGTASFQNLRSFLRHLVLDVIVANRLVLYVIIPQLVIDQDLAVAW